MQANPLDPVRTNLELYRVLLEQLKSEEQVKKQFEKLQDDLSALFDLRRFEKLEPRLKFNLFDPLRNGAARAIRMQQVCLLDLRFIIVSFILPLNTSMPRKRRLSGKLPASRQTSWRHI